MWTWERERRPKAAEPEAQLGEITLSGTDTAANLGGERRWLEVCSPGGYSWRPGNGARVLVLKTPAGEAPCVLGVMQQQEQLLPGQVKLSGANSSILLGDRVEIEGEILINGVSLEEYIRTLVSGMQGG